MKINEKVCMECVYYPLCLLRCVSCSAFKLMGPALGFPGWIFARRLWDQHFNWIQWRENTILEIETDVENVPWR